MKKLNSVEKREINQDWKNVLEGYSQYKSLHFLKRNGPILFGVYLNSVYGGQHYSIEFHLHSLMTTFPVVSLGARLSFVNNKKVPDSISYKRHKNEFNEIISKFKFQFPEAFLQTLSSKILDGIYRKSIFESKGYPYEDMKNHILILYWCNNERLVDETLIEYKNIIKLWPEFAKSNFNGEDGWENHVRSHMNMDKLIGTVSEELIKLNLTDLTDYGLICG